MGKLNRELVARMMQGGDSDTRIASLFGVSRQAVNLLRQSLVSDGILAPSKRRRPAPRRGAASERGKRLPSTPPPTSTPGPAETYRPTPDQLSEWITVIITDAAETRRLRAECESAAKEIDGLRAEVGRLHEMLSVAYQDPAAGREKPPTVATDPPLTIDPPTDT